MRTALLLTLGGIGAYLIACLYQKDGGAAIGAGIPMIVVFVMAWRVRHGRIKSARIEPHHPDPKSEQN
jgi:hypothetical protein